MRNLPRPSMRWASAGILTDAVGPTAAIRPSRMTTVWPVSTRSRSIGRTATSTNANGPAAGADGARVDGVESVEIVGDAEAADVAPMKVDAASAARTNMARLGIEFSWR